jgi:glycosyltransferase involved in cell wall biosynthesis
MNLVFITEARYTKNKNKEIYYENPSFSYLLWQNYLAVFDTVIVVARVKFNEQHDEENAFIASGENVHFIELPAFIGAGGYLFNIRKLQKQMCKILHIKNAVYLCRIPGNIGHTAIKILLKANRSYGVEVVGDPWDVFSGNLLSHPIRILFKIVSYNRLKYDVKFSKASLFVTENYLQKRYRPSAASFTIGVSDVIISEEDFYSPIERLTVNNEIFTIISIGSLEQMYKSPHILLKSIKQVMNQGYQLHLNWLGDGRFKNSMIELARETGLEKNVSFHGNVGKNEIREQFKNSNLFVLISQTEGLPRSMIEAMAYSLPCIGSNVGGIPELISSECLVEVNNIKETADLIIKFISDQHFLNKQGEINFIKAKKFEEKTLKEKRKFFLEYLVKPSNEIF